MYLLFDILGISKEGSSVTSSIIIKERASQIEITIKEEKTTKIINGP